MARLTREKKKELVAKLKDWFTSSPSFVFVHFNGLNIKDEQKMRNELRDQGLRYYVTRKTLIKRALEESNLEGEMPELEGEIAIAVMEDSEDITAPAREIARFAKEFDNALQIVGGVFEGKYKSAAEMNEIASIPSHDVLKGMFVNVINSPIQGFVIALSEIAKKKEA